MVVVILAMMMPLENFANQSIGLLIVQSVLFAYFLVYFVVAVKCVYESSWLVTTLKSGLILFGYMIVVSVAIESSSSFLIITD